jgi:hypothetical protein
MENNSGTHEWLIEFEKEPNNFEFFKAVLDDTLKKQNSDYEAKRYNNFVLHFPLIRQMPTDSFYKWLKFNNKIGGQYKIPRLSNDRKILEEILAVNAQSETGN